MKTNKDLNKAHETKQAERVRPKGPVYDFTELEKVIRIWAQDRR
jgi:hypothetical protein